MIAEEIIHRFAVKVFQPHGYSGVSGVVIEFPALPLRHAGRDRRRGGVAGCWGVRRCKCIGVSGSPGGRARVCGGAGCCFRARARDRARVSWARQRPGARGGLAGRSRPGGGARSGAAAIVCHCEPRRGEAISPSATIGYEGFADYSRA